MSDIAMGVEIELGVTNKQYCDTTHASEYDIMSAADKANPRGREHRRNGRLALAVEVVSDDFLQVGYDNTASPSGSESDGFELRGRPADLGSNVRAWSRVYDSWLMEHLSASERCGMHVHVSGDDITHRCTVALHDFVNAPENGELLNLVAGRYNTTYCIVRAIDRGDLDALFHSHDCRRTTRQGKKIDLGEVPGYNTETEWVNSDAVPGNFCCSNMRQFRLNVASHRYRRYALNLTPYPQTGDLEFRLFASPETKIQLQYRLEFVHALIKYCQAAADVTFRSFCEWLMEGRERRVQYRNLYRHLRNANYVQGLIPRING
jgi:hypothetical protein